MGIKSRKSKKNKQYNGKKEKDNMIHRKLKIDQHEPTKNRRWTRMPRKGG